MVAEIRDLQWEMGFEPLGTRFEPLEIGFDPAILLRFAKSNF